MNTLGELIQEIRKEKDLSLRDAAKLCGLSHSYINNLEKGRDSKTQKLVSPTMDTLEKISKGLSIPLDKLTGFSQGTQLSTFQEKPKKPKDLLKILAEEDYTLNGRIANDEDREKLKQIYELMYWDAKAKNKRKK